MEITLSHPAAPPAGDPKTEKPLISVMNSQINSLPPNFGLPLEDLSSRGKVNNGFSKSE